MSFKTVIVAGGARGQIGPFIVEALIASGKFNKVAILTRSETTAHEKFKKRGVLIVEANYADHDALVNALRGFEAFVSAVGRDGFQQQIQLAKAAKDAGVVRFLPSEFGVDTSREDLDHPVFKTKSKIAADIQATGLEVTRVATGFWIDTFLANTPIFLDIENNKATIYGDGNVVFSWTHRRDVGRAVVGVLLNAEESRNKVVRIQGDRKSLNELVADVEQTKGVKFDVTYKTLEETREAAKQNPGFLLFYLVEAPGRPDLTWNNTFVDSETYIPEGGLLDVSGSASELLRSN